MTSAYWTNLIAEQGDHQYGGYVIGSLSPGQEPVQQIACAAAIGCAWR